MRHKTTIITLISLSLLGLGLLSLCTPTGYTRIGLIEESRGDEILSVVAPDGEPVILTWRNSQFGYQVTEIFYARGGLIIQDQVTFAEPGGPLPPRVSADDVADLYHTGATFDARGLNRPFSRIVYRIGEIGNTAADRIQISARASEVNSLVSPRPRYCVTNGTTKHERSAARGTDHRNRRIVGGRQVNPSISTVA
jgi:hypothetical protein